MLAAREDARLDHEGVANAVRLLLLTGCRVGEILALKWEDVDFEAGALVIRNAKAGGRRHSIGAIVVAMLAEMPRPGPWVVYGRDPGKPLSQSTLSAAWDKIRTAAGLVGVRLHDLRHTVGTYAGQAAANAFLVRDKLGHKTLAMTGQYVNRNADPLRELSDKIEGRISAALTAGAWRAGEVVELKGRRKR